MKKLKRIIALVMTLAVMLVMAACSSNPAPENYNLSAAGVVVDSLTKVVGDRTYVSRTDNSSDGRTDSILVNYSGATSDDVSAYAAYLRTQGFMDYYGIDGVQMCLAKRDGDGAAVASARLSDDTLAVKLEWKSQLALFFGETQYVSGSSLAILPSPEMIVFDYPVLGDAVEAQETVNQLILDGVNEMIQYAKDAAAGADYKLMGGYTVDSALVSDTRITLTGELTIGETTQNISMTIAINDILSAPTAQYGEISAQ